MAEKNWRDHKLDLDSGYITKSPCRECALKKHLPRCSQGCAVLDQLQGLLVDLISCSNSFADLEPYSLPRQEL